MIKTPLFHAWKSGVNANPSDCDNAIRWLDSILILFNKVNDVLHIFFIVSKLPIKFILLTCGCNKCRRHLVFQLQFLARHLIRVHGQIDQMKIITCFGETLTPNAL